MTVAAIGSTRARIRRSLTVFTVAFALVLVVAGIAAAFESFPEKQPTTVATAANTAIGGMGETHYIGSYAVAAYSIEPVGEVGSAAGVQATVSVSTTSAELGALADPFGDLTFSMTLPSGDEVVPTVCGEVARFDNGFGTFFYTLPLCVGQQQVGPTSISVASKTGPATATWGVSTPVTPAVLTPEEIAEIASQQTAQ